MQVGMEEVRMKVNTEVLKERSDAARHKIKTIQKRFQRMEQMVCNSKRYWEGEANQAHCREFLEYQQEIDEILKRFIGHIVDLEKIAHVYENTENEIIKLDLPQNVLE